MAKYQGWKKITPGDYSAAEAFLLEREPFCVGACSRFIAGYSHAWRLKNSRGEIAALLFHNRRSLYPLFSANAALPLPKFLASFLQKVPIHSVQGLKEDAQILEQAMERHGCYAEESIDYDLMTLDEEPFPECFQAGPAALVLRKPVPTDAERLFHLQAAYEQEEVIPRNGTFYPSACRKNLEKLLASEQVLIACLGNEIVGKINTSAVSFTRCQIGGVYVRPEYRGQGIAVRMSAVFLRDLLADRRGITLFVKKRTASARSVYRRLGFITRGDYRISYF
jgi:ribosomal protein S18 acetylase RimI-like enzyme